MAEFLFELFCEEIPARFQARAQEDLERLFEAGLDAEGLSCESIRTFVTPRRLVLAAGGMPRELPATREERKGPRIDAPQKAIDGFLRSAGLSSLSECRQVETPKGMILVADREIPARQVSKILPEILWGILQNFPWPKSQNWSEGAFRWVRPLRSILAVFDGEPLPNCLYLGDGTEGTPPELRPADSIDGAEPEQSRSYLVFGNTTRGHRFLDPQPFAVTGWSDYESGLRRSHVILDREERKRIIVEQSAKVLAPHSLTLSPDEPLLEEVCGLVEWPVPLLGQINAEYMEMPSEVLTTTMRNHQKYFATVDEAGKMAPCFVVAANLETADHGAAIIAGNERVLSARLADAKFFWDLDRRETLASRLPRLSAITFHAQLGSMAEKAKRLEGLSREIVKSLSRHPEFAENDEDIIQASRLAKADLVCGMVGEFPELQGIMGSYYAENDGTPAAVARAIREHYSPQGPGDSCPDTPASIVVALSDRIDTLTGFFGIGEKPTGRGDAYGLRRAALGVLRLIIENKLRFDIRKLWEASYATYEAVSQESAAEFRPRDQVADTLCGFMADRVRSMLREKGYRHDIIEAVFTARSIGDIAGDLTLLSELQETLQTEEGSALLRLYARAANILKIEEKKDGASYVNVPLDEALLAESAEKELNEKIDRFSPAISSALDSEDYESAMRTIVSLRPSLDAFFDEVLVNAPEENLRRNRLALLARLRGLFHQIADFTAIEGVAS